MTSTPPQTSILRLTDEDTLRLIEYYHQESCLWNTNDPDYRNRTKRINATQRISLKLGVKHFEAKHVIIKFKNIRNSYCQELKKIAHSVQSGETPVYQPRVVWFNKIDSFLRPHLNPTAARSFTFPAIDPQNEIQQAAAENANLHQDYFELEDSSSSNIIKLEKIDTSDKSDYGEENDFEVSKQEGESIDLLFNEEEPPQIVKRRRLDNTNSVFQSVASTSSPRPNHQEVHLVPQVMHSCIEQSQSTPILHNIAMCLESLANKEQDVFDRFGSYVASMLRSLPSSRALMLQPKIVALLVEDTTIKDGLKPHNSK